MDLVDNLDVNKNTSRPTTTATTTITTTTTTAMKVILYLHAQSSFVKKEKTNLLRIQKYFISSVILFCK